MKGLDKFFKPSSVAIIGASHKQGKIGYTILENFAKYGYAGKIFPVNPDTTPIFDLKVYRSVKEIPDKLDMAVICIPASVVPKALAECVEKKVKSVVIVSGGFSETCDEGKQLEHQLKKIITGSSTGVMGPNCLGVYDPSTQVDTIFDPKEKLLRPSIGDIGVISQAGSIGATILDKLAEDGIGISKFISYENGMDVNECDSLEYLGEDEKTKTIVLFLEGVKDGKRFIKVLRNVTKKKPVIVLKGGKSERGALAVASHTGAMAGSARIYSGVFKQAGAIEAKDWEELFDFAKAFSQTLPKGNRIAVITNGGGFAILAVDECEVYGLSLPEPSKKLKAVLMKHIPPYGSINNPFDLTGDATSQRYKSVIEGCLKSGEYDGVIVIALFQTPTLERDITDVLVDLKKCGKTMICCSAGSRYTISLSRALEKSGIPVYSTPTRAVKAMAVLFNYRAQASLTK